jgi:hypothetical protein
MKKIYNQEKTKELNKDELDFTFGYLKDDQLFVQHHEAVAEIKGRTAEELYNEKLENGEDVTKIENKYYSVVKRYPANQYRAEGATMEEITDEATTPAKEAYDEYEEILIYVPFTSEELKMQLRAKRVTECFKYINRGELWYSNLTEEQKEELRQWYQSWLDVTETLVVPQKPNWLN